MSAHPALDEASDTRSRWTAIDAQLNRLRSVHAALTDLRGAVARGTAPDSEVEAVWTALDALGGEDSDWGGALWFLAGSVGSGRRTLTDELQADRDVDPAAARVATLLVSFAEDTTEWSAVEGAIGDIIGGESVDRATLGDLTALFGLAVGASIDQREQESDRLVATVRDAYDAVETALPPLDEQPIALLPVRLETRFVDETGGRDFVDDRETDPAHLLVRVYPDQFHIDSHESELTDDEVEWGARFWTILWFARHPEPAVVPRDIESPYLRERIPERRLREIVTDLVGDVDAEKFSDAHHDRYQELKERAWKKLVDRFGRERAAYVVHSLEPTDEELAIDLLTPPPAPPETDEARDDDEHETVVRKSDGQLVASEDDTPAEDDAARSMDGVERDVTGGARSRPDPAESPDDRRALLRSIGEHHVVIPSVCWLDPGESDRDDDGDDEPPLPERLPSIEFPEVPRRPTSWTKSARAELLPDRWVGIVEWTDSAGNSNRTAVAGEPIRDPLQVGPGLESVAEDLLTETSESDSPAPDGAEWLVDFGEAEDAGMALRIPLAALGGFDHRRGFDRVSVVGVKASMSAQDTPDALADLFDAHHYTDGLSLLEQGTPTNNHDRPSGYSRREEPRESMAVECIPPKVTPGDRSDGDLLARALAIDRGGGTDHVFANVANADGTEQRSARHMNSALWPATLGYFLQHILVDNRFAGNPSIWNGQESGTEPSVNTHLLELDAYRRHFIRYVRGRGPFPAIRIGRHPYGILPATAVETERDLSVLESPVLSELVNRQATLDDLRDRGYELSDLAGGGIDPELLVAAGAPADAVMAAGAESTHPFSGSVSSAGGIRREQVTPPALTRDGVGLTTTSRLSEARLEAAGIDVGALETAGVSVGDLARGTVTERQLNAADVTVEQLGDVVLCEGAKQLGITPDALKRAGVSSTALLRGEFAEEQITALGLDTRAVYDAILPRRLKQAGITVKQLQDAGVSSLELLNGEVDDDALRAGGIDPEPVVTALVPSELLGGEVTADRLQGAGITPAALFNGTITDEELRRAGISAETVTHVLLPAAFRDSGVTAADLRAAGITPAAVVNGNVAPADLEAAGIDPETLAAAGVLTELVAADTTEGELEAAEPDARRIGTDGGSTGSLPDDPPYAVTVLEDPTQAERDLYRFSFDPATPRTGPGPGSNLDLAGTPELDRHGTGTDEETGDGERGTAGGPTTREIPVARPRQIDHTMRSEFSRRVSGFGAHWGAAAADLPFGAVMDEDDLIRALKRTAVSADTRHRTMVYSGEAAAASDHIVAEVSELFLSGHQGAVRDALETAQATDLDPRVASLYPYDSDSFEHPEAGSDLRTLQFPRFHRLVGTPHQGIVAPHDDVDADIDRFIDILCSSRWRDIEQLGDPLDFGQNMWLPPPMVPRYPLVMVNTDAIEESAEEWGAVDTPRRRRFVEEIETSDDPLEHVERLVEESRGTNKPAVMAENQADFGDSGVLRSLLRVLLQFGTLQSYITARRRLGAAYDDPPDGWPELSLWTDERGPLDSLDDQIPPQLSYHPVIDDPAMSYGDALHVAASDYSTTTSIDSRVSEYMDSLAYLRRLEPVDLAALMHETLDLANHRLDAWWTSIATKDLFELRELQGSSDGQVDHDTWAGAGSDAPLATVDPALVGYVGGEFHAPGQTGDDVDLSGGDDTRGTQDSRGTRDVPDPDTLPDRASAEPGLYVGGYGFVENLQPDLDPEAGPEYIHAPSEQHATTAALLRSGWHAHEADEGGNVMEMELSPERVRAGLWLIRGVRRGQSVGELLGFRFERWLHEETLADASELDRDEVNLMQYLDVFRSVFPATVGTIERPDDPGADDTEGTEALAARDTVDGYLLVKQWDEYPFDRDGDLPAADGDDTTEYEVLEAIVAELQAAVRAAGNVLTAESVHQLGAGDFEQVGGSIEALAKGEPFPDPEVVNTPRTETGFAHRQCVLLEATTTPPVDRPRSRAAPAVATWVDDTFPDRQTVECRATCHWSDADGEDQSASTTLTLADLELGPLDVLYLFGSDAEDARSELESRLVYHLLRDPPHEGVPPDATVELSLAATERAGATSVADLLEFARSVRTLVQESRPVRADDLTHPSEARGAGYDEETLAELSERTHDAWVGLYLWAEVVDERVAVLDADHAVGDAVDDLPHPTERAPMRDDGESTGGSWGSLAGGSMLPGSRSAAVSGEPTEARATVTDQVERLVDAAEAVDADVPVSLVKSVVESIDPGALVGELETVLSSLPAGPTSRRAIRASYVVPSSTDATITGPLDQEPVRPAVSGSSNDGDGSAERTAGFEESMGDDADGENAAPTENGEAERELDDEPVTVRVWGTDGISWFERETSATVADNTFTATVDLSSVAPGTPFTVAAVRDGEVRYAADGRVVGDPTAGGDTPGDVLRTACPNLRRLLWLVDASDELRVDRGPVGQLATAVETADWDRIAEERDGMDSAGTVLTAADLEAVDALLAFVDVDPELVASATLRLTDPVSRTGLHRLFTVTGDDPTADGMVRYREGPALTEVRARLHHALESPAMYDDISPRLLSYDPRTAVHLATRSDGPVIAAYLDDFLAGSDRVVRDVTDPAVDAVSLLSRLSAWLYDPDSLVDPDALASQLRTLSASIEDYPVLATLFEELPRADGTSTVVAFGNHLETVAEFVEAGPGEVPSSDDAGAAFASARSTAAVELRSELAEMRLAIDGVVAAESVPESFREGVLESLREPLALLANYGVMGATPRVPVGGTSAAEDRLLEQARAVLGRVRQRLAEMERPDEEGSVETRVAEHVDRLERLFGDGFTVLPPFRPTNPDELVATFTSDSLIPEDRALAAESWLQRAATVRDRIDDFREARTYGEVLMGSPGSPLTIGQVPYEPGDTWVGVDGVDPPPGRLSLVAQFGPALDPAGVTGRLTGLFVDEWHESIPEETTTTGVALQYDDPGSRAPNAVLLVPPPADRPLSLDDLAAVVAETGEWTRRRAVDYGDMDGIDHLLPGLYLPVAGARRRQPLVDLRMLDWYDWKAVDDLLDPSLFRDQVATSVADEPPFGGDGE